MRHILTAFCVFFILLVGYMFVNYPYSTAAGYPEGAVPFGLTLYVVVLTIVIVLAGWWWFDEMSSKREEQAAKSAFVLLLMGWIGPILLHQLSVHRSELNAVIDWIIEHRLLVSFSVVVGPFVASYVHDLIATRIRRAVEVRT